MNADLNKPNSASEKAMGMVIKWEVLSRDVYPMEDSPSSSTIWLPEQGLYQVSNLIKDSLVISHLEDPFTPVYMNENFCVLTGLPKRSLLYRTNSLRELIHEDDQRVVLLTHAGLYNNQRDYTVCYRLSAESGFAWHSVEESGAIFTDRRSNIMLVKHIQVVPVKNDENDLTQ